jgi:hypothetical protein
MFYVAWFVGIVVTGICLWAATLPFDTGIEDDDDA